MHMKPISVGDLVMVVRGHSCAIEVLGGVPFKVTNILQRTGTGWTCNRCMTPNIAGDVYYGVQGAPVVKGVKRLSDHTSLPITWVKRIPPLEELEGEKRDERITA